MPAIALARVIFFLCLCFMLTCCSTRSALSSHDKQSYMTLIVAGDEKGVFEAALAHHLNTLGILSGHVQEHSLHVEIKATKTAPTGYQREKSLEGSTLNSMVASTKSYTLTADLFFTFLGRHCRQKIEIEPSFDYVPEPYTADQLALSLGLLTTEKQAYEENLHFSLDALALEVALWIKSRVILERGKASDTQ